MLYVPRNASKKLVPAADLDYVIEEYKAGQTTGFRIFAPQSENTKSCFIALFELIVTVPVDNFTIYR
jgi:hypothetical protein